MKYYSSCEKAIVKYRRYWMTASQLGKFETQSVTESVIGCVSQ
jgi:hypothetical protein